jgi:hypothetical protein
MKERFRNLLVGAGLAVALMLGATEAFAGRGALNGDCEVCNAIQYNWCAPSLGGEPWCDACCVACDWTGGNCHSMAETEAQGCECFDT